MFIKKHTYYLYIYIYILCICFYENDNIHLSGRRYYLHITWIKGRPFGIFFRNFSFFPQIYIKIKMNISYTNQSIVQLYHCQQHIMSCKALKLYFFCKTLGLLGTYQAFEQNLVNAQWLIFCGLYLLFLLRICITNKVKSKLVVVNVICFDCYCEMRKSWNWPVETKKVVVHGQAVPMKVSTSKLSFIATEKIAKVFLVN